jgi:hypothetical protein
MFKLIINTFLFTKYRKYILQKILSDITSGKHDFCCYVEFKGKSFICWKDLKEVRETLQTTKILIEWKTDYLINNPTCETVWFDNKEQRLAFLKECLNKFKK